MPKKLKFLKQLTFVILTEDPENLLVLCLLLPLPQLGGHQLGKLLPFHLQDIRHPIKTFLPFHLKVTPFNENTPHFPHTGCAIQSEHSSHSTFRLCHPMRTLLKFHLQVTPSNQNTLPIPRAVMPSNQNTIPPTGCAIQSERYSFASAHMLHHPIRNAARLSHLASYAIQSERCSFASARMLHHPIRRAC